MKTFGTCLMSSGLTIILMLLLIPIDQGERCETMQAAYDTTQGLYEERLAQQQAITDYALSRVAVAQQQHQKRSEVDEMRAIAAKWAPVEKAAKVEATMNHAKVDTSWWQWFKAEGNRLAGKVPAPRVP